MRNHCKIALLTTLKEDKGTYIHYHNILQKFYCKSTGIFQVKYIAWFNQRKRLIFSFGQSKHPPPTTQEMTVHIDITRWSNQNQIDYICSERWRSSIQSANIRPEADCSSDHEFLIIKFVLK